MSSGEDEWLSSFLVGLVIAEHGPEHVDPSAGQGEYGLGVPLALGAFAVVEGPGCGASLDADHGRGVEDALELSVVALGSMQVSCAIARVARGRRKSGVAGEVIGGGEPGQRAADGGQELGAEDIANPGQAGDDGGVLLGVETRRDFAIDVG